MSLLVECVDGVAKAVARNYPLMGFSAWHRLVADSLGPLAMGCNAVIVWKGRNVVVKGECFRGTRYFKPLKVVVEASRSEGRVEVELPEWSGVHDVARIVRGLI